MRGDHGFGQRIARAQDEILAASGSIARARARWVGAARPQRGTPRRSLAWGRWVALAAPAVAACIVLWSNAARPLAFDVGPGEGEVAGAPPQPGVVGEWIAAPSHERLPIHFTDGSNILLGTAAQARVVELAPGRARVVLERGEAGAHVVHGKDTRWSVQAGPFVVRITGTRFDVGWDPDQQVFTLRLLEGAVSLSGCSLAAERIVAAGETFRATCKDGKLSPVASDPAATATASTGTATATPPAAAPSTPAQGDAPVVRSVGADSTRAAADAGSVAAEARDAEAVPAWSKLAMAGKYRDAAAAADAAGLPALCAQSAAEDLLRLADVERFGGRLDDAEFVLRELRRRFPGDRRAAVAAYHLGRMAFDERARYAEAVRWFDAYLREQPEGPLAREAAGRRMEALDQSGDHAGARAAAAQYLAAFPDGPHADVARRIAAP